jgi:hypothetical protein
VTRGFKLKFAVGVIVALVVVLLAVPAHAAQKKSRFRSGSEVRSAGPDTNVVKEDGKNVIYKKRNVVDFDDSLVEGDVHNPSEFYFVHRPEQPSKNLVAKRKNFHKEMLRDAVMIK